MNRPALKTAAEQRLEWLENLNRPLTDAESDELRRALHAVYCRNRRIRAEVEANAPALAEHAASEARLLEKMQAEAGR